MPSVLSKVIRAANLDDERTAFSKAEFVLEKVEDLPKGYPQLAAYINSDPDFAIYRRFGFLQNRLLLYRQNELEVLQKRLQELDQTDEKDDRHPLSNDNPRLYSWQWDISHPKEQSKLSERAELMDDIELKMTKYYELLLHSRQILSLNPPKSRNHRSLFTWIYNEKPIDVEEDRFIFNKEDLVGLSATGEFQSPLAAMMHSVMDRLKHMITIWRTTKNARKEQQTVYFSSQSVTVPSRLLFCLLTVAFLMAPIFVLVDVEVGNTICTVIVLVCVLCFSSMLSVFTDAKEQDIFNATAAYCAVLLVFLGVLIQK